jgi:predicted NAD-dependent protein-ADP-ribosyltransferase YbiA (DUF1768 family)
MAKEIKIFNPGDKPFGILSNNYHERYKEEENKIIKSALTKGIEAMFRNPNLADLLLSTGNGKIYYLSPNPLIGVGENGKGKNLYGILLEQERNKLRVQMNKVKKQKDKEFEMSVMYDIFLAEKGLTIAIKSGDNLKTFLGKTPKQIVDSLGRTELEEGSLSREEFLINFQKGHYASLKPFINNVDNLVNSIRKKMLPELRNTRSREKRKQIFNMYADYLLAKKGIKPEQYEEAKEQQFSSREFHDQAYALEQRLFDLYESGMLSERLSSEIDIHFKHYYIPSEQEIIEVNKLQISLDKKVEQKDLSNKNLPTDKIYVLPPVADSNYDQKFVNHIKYVPFGPLSFCDPLLVINGYAYLTVYHYFVEELLRKIGEKNPRSYIVKKPQSNFPISRDSFLDPRESLELYERKKEEVYESNLVKYATEKLEEKFKSRQMQDFLLATGKAKLVFNDPNDPVLGIGSEKTGKNIAGKLLMEIRDRIIEERNEEQISLLTTDDITWILNKNSFMRDWVIRRVNDSCRTLMVIKNYVKEKFKTETTIYKSPKFVSDVIDNIFQPCSHVYGVAHEIKAPFPKYFVDIVKKCDDMQFASDEVIEILWKRIAAVIYHLIIHISKTGAKIQDKDISSEIGRIQILTSERIKCERIVSNEYDNCIIAALVNLIRGIVHFNKENNRKTRISNEEVRAATSIILESVVNLKFTSEKHTLLSIRKEISEGDEGGDELEEEEVNAEDREEDQEEEEVNAEDREEDQEEDALSFHLTTDDENEDYGSGTGSEFSPHEDSIADFLKNFEEFKDQDVDSIAIAIDESVKFIRSNTVKISAQIKRNRVNFFSGQS